MFLFLCPQPFDEICEFFLMIVGRNSQFFMHSFDEIWDDFSPQLNDENCHLFPRPLIKCKIFSMVVWGDSRFLSRWITDTRNSYPHSLPKKKKIGGNISAIFHTTHCKFLNFFSRRSFHGIQDFFFLLSCFCHRHIQTSLF